MPNEEFEKLKHLSDPMIGENEHYKPFKEVFGTTNTEKDRPSLSNSMNVKVLPFSPTIRHVKNVDVMVQCEECDLWRLLYSNKKLSLQERKQLQVRYSGGCVVFMWGPFH